MVMDDAGFLQLSPDMKCTTEKDGSVVYRLENTTGDMVMTCYKVFPGIHLVYNDVHMSSCDISMKGGLEQKRFFEIDHCHEGRMECSDQKEFFYLSQGDLAVHPRISEKHERYYPTHHYHGISLVIDIDASPRCLSCILDDVYVDPDKLMEKFCSRDELFVARANERLNHIFAELYDLPESAKCGYIRIKTLEILLFLSFFPIDKMQVKSAHTYTQVCLAKNICRYLTQNMDQHITIDEMARQFNVSASQLKSCFRSVYGESVYGYIKGLKMQSAAKMLISTDKSVLEIANLHGYENGGKFAAAFSSVMEMTPMEYRKTQAR